MSDYIMSPSLQRAVDTALLLDRPLLLSGEPGTGKTTLAKHLAETYSEKPPPGCAPFSDEVLVFNTKTVSQATDLFYSYDSLSRLRDAYLYSNRGPAARSARRGPEGYIRLQALGKAIVAKHGSQSPELNEIRGILDFKIDGALPEQPVNSIVLIDEIDKAPRDFPNDLLNEIDKQEFDIRELPAHVPRAKNNARILILLTSNNEKNLPDAFLRRCIYHYILFPEGKQLEDIIRAHFPSWDNSVDVSAVKAWINKVRKLELARKPATGEFIDWLRLLDGQGLLTALKASYSSLSDTDKDRFLDSFGALVKNNYDMDQVQTAAKNS